MEQPDTTTIELSLEENLKRAKYGDQSAFADLVREHQGMVFSIARNFFRDSSLAEDLAQEVFLHLYRNLSALESPDHLKFWLRRVTSHRCIDYSRRQKMKTVSMDEANEFASGSHLPDNLPDTMMSSTLRRIVATLPDTPRIVVTLRYQEDLDPMEIARILDMPLNTVKSHLKRSLVILREKVTRCFGEVEV